MNKGIELKNITKVYSPTAKIENINFSVGKGEIVALCGGNGAGKSTIIKILTGIIKQSDGVILLDGQPVDTISKAYRTIFSYMPDDMLFPRQLTALEVLRFYSSLLGVENDRVMEILELVGLYDVKDKVIKQFSKGMQQRLSLGQALLGDTPILILDEPTNGLDPYWVVRFKEILQEEKRKGKAILFTTHILSLVEDAADKAAFLGSGQLLHFDTVHDLIHTGGERRTLESVFFENQIKTRKEKGSLQS